MRIANINDIRLHWREDGDPQGIPVIFANSLGTDLRLWDEIIPLLPQGLRLIRFDKRGHGLSSCPPAPYSMDDLVDDTEALLKHLSISRCVFVGLSIGGMIGQSLAARRPEMVQALVLSNTAAKMGEASAWQDRIATIRAGGIQALADPIMERWFGPKFRATPAATLWRNMLTRTPQEGYLGCCAAIAGTDLTNTTRQLRLPVLGIAGEQDQASPPDLVGQTLALIPDAQFTVLSNAGHLPCVESPQAFAQVLTDFLKETTNV